ncbi:unnamed protein product [Pylaiella littoralis]
MGAYYKGGAGWVECRACAEIARRARKKGTTRGKDVGQHAAGAKGRSAAAGHRANNFIEELSLGPGVERTLRVRYCAASPAPTSAGAVGPDDDDDEAAVPAATAAAATATTATATTTTTSNNKSSDKSSNGSANTLAKPSSGAATAVAVSSQARGGGRLVGSANARGTKLGKQAFKLYLVCQEPRGQWDDALPRGDDVDAEGFPASRELLRRKPSVGSDVGQFSKNIAGRAMVCTSVLSVVPREIAFGNCNIGEYKSQSLEISNLSDLPALAIAHVVSKVVSCKPAKLHLQPARQRRRGDRRQQHGHSPRALPLAFLQGVCEESHAAAAGVLRPRRHAVSGAANVRHPQRLGAVAAV